jgi:hypothetical protein
MTGEKPITTELIQKYLDENQQLAGLKYSVITNTQSRVRSGRSCTDAIGASSQGTIGQAREEDAASVPGYSGTL